MNRTRKNNFVAVPAESAESLSLIMFSLKRCDANLLFAAVGTFESECESAEWTGLKLREVVSICLSFVFLKFP